uniref:Ig-like domain-containing protein n=1 Tax=Panagrolaimus sp. JU765 TaxID=591449 RepID=A0AC34PXY6_9BILA
MDSLSWLIKLSVLTVLPLSVFSELRAKGSPHGVIQVKSGAKSIGMTPLPSAEPLILWCQAVKMELNKKPPVKLKDAVFRSALHHEYRPKLVLNNTMANLTLPNVPVTEAGIWSCELVTDEGNTTGFIDVYLRPIIFSRHAIRVEPQGTSQFQFDGAGVTIFQGQDAVLTCPVFGHPKPNIHWRIFGSDQALRNSGHYKMNTTSGELTIKNVTYADENVYVCIATNVHNDGSKKAYELQLERKLRVKSPMAWVLPLLIIIAILVSLVVTITVCEWRKRRREQKLIILEPEDE